MKQLSYVILMALALAINEGCQSALAPETALPTPDVTATPPPEITTPPEEFTPPPSPTPYQLADQCVQTGSYRLQVANDPSGVYSPFAAAEEFPSPDKRWIAYRDGQGMRIRDSTSGASALLTDSYAYPIYSNQWTPDGNHLALLEKIDFYTNGSDMKVKLFDLSGGLNGIVEQSLPLVESSNPLVGGWSPDGNYLLLIYHGTLTAPPRIMAWSLAEQKFIFESKVDSLPIYILRQTWSPDGAWLAFTWEGTGSAGGLQSHWLTMVALPGGQANALLLSEGSYDSSIYDSTLLWSPDSQQMALVRGPTLALYRPDASAPYSSIDIPDRWQGAHTEWNINAGPSAFPWVSWADSQSIMVWRQPIVGKFELDHWPLAGTALEPMMITTRRPFFPPQVVAASVAPRLAIYIPGETNRIDLIDPDGSGAIPFVTGADDAGDPDWSPTGQTVAAVWDTAAGDARRIRLAWSDPQGRDSRYIDTPYVDIRNLFWSPDGKALTFIGVGADNRFAVELLDMATGQHQVLIDALANVIYPRYFDQGTFYTLRWRAVSGVEGFSGFDRAGAQAFRFVVSGDVARASELFFSPDRAMAAVKVRLPGLEEFHILPADGGVGTIARKNLSGLGDPIWSPDSHLIAFSQSINYQIATLQIIDREGHDVWQQDGYGLYWAGPLVWQPCE